MYSESDLDSAVAAGVLSPEAALALRSHVAGQRSSSVVDEEHFRLLTGFNDIFVAIAGILVLVGAGWIGGEVAPWLGGALVAACSWGLAEYFTLRRRMALPSIVFLLAFAGGVMTTFADMLLGNEGLRDNDTTGALLMAAAAAMTAGATWLHWRRFKVPITVAAGAAACVGIIVSLLLAIVPGIGDSLMWLMLACGVAVFVIAMRWDLSDRDRQTRRSDVAFWLHLLAAPMIVHPIFDRLGILDGDAQLWKAGVVLGIYGVLAIIALLVDRRALMVSGLAYVLTAMIQLFREFGAVSLNVALAAVVIGSALLLLSAFWHTARSKLIALAPGAWPDRLPPTALAT
jgi:hypothetical protein